jgi:predicted nucleic acid-binding protein
VKSDAAANARRALDAVFEELGLLELDGWVEGAAGEVADRFGLRANDAIHLASALALDDPRVVLVTWDRELAAAARRAELAVAP